MSTPIRRCMAYHEPDQNFILSQWRQTKNTHRIERSNMRLTDLLAIYGASLSTAVAVSNYFRTRPKIRVLLILGVGEVEGKSQTGIFISIQNVSTQQVHIANVSFLYPYASWTLRAKLKHFIRYKRILRNYGWCHSSLSLHGIEDGCPVSIEPGKSHLIFVRHEVLDGLLECAWSRRVKAVAQDALWRNTYSKAFEYATQQ